LFRAEMPGQDGFAYRAVKVWTGDVEPAQQTRPPRSSAACHSSLTLTFDPLCPDDVLGPQA
jgi:CspA family cold shock protein